MKKLICNIAMTESRSMLQLIALQHLRSGSKHDTYFGRNCPVFHLSQGVFPLILHIEFGTLMNTRYTPNSIKTKKTRREEGIGEVHCLAPKHVMSAKELPINAVWNTYLHSPTLHPQVSPQLQLLEPQFWLTVTTTV